MSGLKELKDQFYLYYTKKITLRDFESWLYHSPELEEDIGKDFYFQLIDINYRDKFAGDHLEKVMFSRFQQVEFEEKKIRELLENFAEKIFRKYWNSCIMNIVRDIIFCLWCWLMNMTNFRVI
ncbi:hypothetical protein SAMN04488025_1398 [Planifilum fulgidum]|uniref:Uncharacterized protein n=1 Tax=Planifilum fulgidum TaxID=201973 RepID=A0A1I2S9T2_9BACL|nr:hypothetical protein [Planifilum fulgidum]SFG49083.1 hypothetical protein SAMN04488025_1398 [Planifilum fulgidum]